MERSSNVKHSPGELVEIRPRCFSKTKQEWRYTSRYKRSKSASRAPRPVAHSSSSSSGGSQPPSPIFARRPRSRSRSRSRPPIARSPEPIPSSMQLLTWNVEAFGPNAKSRLTTILTHIQRAIFQCADAEEQPEPCAVLLQEVHARALPAVLEHAWVRAHFVVVPTKAEHWPRGASHGNVTLVARTIPVLAAHTLEFAHSPMRRHALAVDVRLGLPDDEEEEDEEAVGERTVRLVNVHLESLAQGTPLRPWQLRAAADALRQPGVHGGVVAGDMNAIAPPDWELPAAVGLQDAWVAGEDDGRSTTWGYQPPSHEFPPGRLDKVLYAPNGVCAVDHPERVGVGVKTSGGQWASDHFGLMTSVRLLAAE